MKRLGILVILAALMIPCTAAAQAGGAVQCSVPVINLSEINRTAVVNKIVDTLLNYDSQVPSLFSAQNGRYEICFKMYEMIGDNKIDIPLEIDDSLRKSITEFNGYFKFAAGKTETRDVYISGLKLKRGADLQASEALLNVENHGEGKILIDGLEFDNVKKGIGVFGKGYVEIRNSRFTGDGKTDDCIRIRTDGVLMDNVEATKCDEGVLIEANNVEITNSKVYDNKIGIHVTNGFSGAKIRRSAVFANEGRTQAQGNEVQESRLNGILIDNAGLVRDLQFYQVVDNEISQFDPLGAAVVEDKVLYIDLPNDNLSQNGKMELFLTDASDCIVGGVNYNPLGQACIFLGDEATFEVKPSDFGENKVLSRELPNEYGEKHLAAIFTDDVDGSTIISQQFMMSGNTNPIIAFVQTPFDIPTTEGGGVAAAGGGVGGSSSTDIQDDSDIVVDDPIIDFADDSGGLSSGGIAGGGGSGDGSGDRSSGGEGGTGALCTLYALNDNHGITSAGIGAIWILLAIAGLGSVRTVYVRKKDKTIDHRP